MLSFLALLPRALTTFFYAVAALLRFYGSTDTTPIRFIPITIRQWSLLAFGLGTAALLANLGLEWNAGNRSRTRAEDERLRAEEERLRAEEERLRAEEERLRARQREARQDDLADEERNRAAEERENADRERNRADQERQRADQERQRAARYARVQNRFIILQIRHQLNPSAKNRGALNDFLAYLEEYGEW
jgi:hypothetical protein